MRCDSIGAQQFTQVMRHALGHAPGVNEDQSRPVLPNQLRQAMINFFPHFIRHHRFKRRTGEFNRQIQFAAVADVYDFTIRIAGLVNGLSADQKSSYFFDRLLCGR